MKLIASDLDGTLLNSKKEISSENVRALKEAQKRGIHIVIATGRNYKNAFNLCQGIDLQAHIISNNGAFVYHQNGQQLMNMGMEKKHVAQAIDWLAQNQYFYYLCTDRQVFMPDHSKEVLIRDAEVAANTSIEFVCIEHQEKIKRLVAMKGVEFFHDIDDILAQDLVFGSLSAITFDQQKLQKGREYFKKYEGLDMTIAGSDIFEMIGSHVSKGRALEHLTNYLGISLQEAMAIGDSYNDISMLEKAGYSVAMGNADREIQEICHDVSLPNDQSGVAHSINKLLSKMDEYTHSIDLSIEPEA